MRREIAEDDAQFMMACKRAEELKIITEKHGKQELMLFSSQRAALSEENSLRSLMLARQDQFNQLV